MDIKTLKEEMVAQMPARLQKNESFAQQVYNAKISKMATPEYDQDEVDFEAGNDITKTGGGGATAPRAGDVFVPPALQNFSIYWQQMADGFIADDALPTVTVPKPKGSYWVWNNADRKRKNVKPMSQGDPVEERFFSLSDKDYSVEKYGIKTSVEDDTIDAQEMDPVDSARVAVESNAEIITIWKEQLFIDKFLNAAAWTDSSRSITNTTSSKNWSGNSSDDPTVDIWTQATAMGKTGYRPNRLILSRDVFDAMLVSDEIRSLMNTGVTPTDPLRKPGQAELAALLGVDMIHVQSAVAADDERDVDSENETTDYMTSGLALLYYAPATAGLYTATGISKFAWQRKGFNGMGEQVRQYYDIENSKTSYQTIMHIGHAVNAIEFGYLWTDLLS